MRGDPYMFHAFSQTTPLSLKGATFIPADVFFTVQTAFGFPGSSETAISDT